MTAAAETSPTERPWNIVFIMADDVGYGDISSFGATKIKPPNIDKIAAEGMKCTAFYTHSICSPSRTAMLTGCYAPRVKQYPRDGKSFNHHPWVHLDEELIPELLKPRGYVSASFGKWDLNGHKVNFPNDITPLQHGFDYFYGRPCGGPQYLNEKISQKQAEPEHFDKVFTDHALRFIEQHKDTSPCFSVTTQLTLLARSLPPKTFWAPVNMASMGTLSKRWITTSAGLCRSSANGGLQTIRWLSSPVTTDLGTLSSEEITP